MPCIGAVPLLLSALLAVLIGLISAGFLRARDQQLGDPPAVVHDDWLLGLLVLAAFASGAFSTLVLLVFGGR